jgi:choice-of-anchor A domain-containing protein
MAGLLLGASSAQAVIALNLNSLTVFGDLDIVSTTVDGPVYVGGDLDGNNPTLVTSSSDDINQYTTTVTVGGDILSDIHINNGSLIYGGSIDSDVNVVMNSGGTVTSVSDGSIDSLTATYKEDAINSSYYFSTLDTTTNASFEIIENKNLSFTLDEGNDYGIVNISYEDLSLQNLDQIVYNISGTGALIINVSGTDVNLSKGNFSSSSTEVSSQVIWNFYEAETLTFDTGFSGSVLAPIAAFESNGQIVGSVVVDSADINNAIIYPNFDDSLSLPAIPEARHYAMLTGLSMLLFVFGKRRRVR